MKRPCGCEGNLPGCTTGAILYAEVLRMERLSKCGDVSPERYTEAMEAYQTHVTGEPDPIRRALNTA